MRRDNRHLEQRGSFPAADVPRAEAVAKLLQPRVHSLSGVVDAEKLIELADKAPPPSPGALPLHLSGSRARHGSDIALLQYTSGSTGDPKASC